MRSHARLDLHTTWIVALLLLFLFGPQWTFAQGQMDWCCRDGEVFPAPAPECEEVGGVPTPSEAEAHEVCRDRHHPPAEDGWCCHEGEVFPAPAVHCEEVRGVFFPSEREAVAHCREASSEPRIPDLKGDDWQRYVGREVSVTGIFVRDSVPLLVTHLDHVLANRPLPEREHILLVGPQAGELEPARFGGAEVRVIGIVVTIDGSGEGPTSVALEVMAVDLLRMVTPYDPRPATVQLRPGVAQPQRYAVLWSGGIDAKNNHLRYWNDLKFMYTALRNLGFPAANIVVLYADGKGRDQNMPVHYAGTWSDFQQVLGLLRVAARSADLVFLFTTNHGGGFEKADKSHPDWYGGELDGDGDEGTEPIKEADYGKDFNGNGLATDQVAWDEGLHTWGGQILDDALATALSGISFNRLVVVMEQCFSGGFIRDIARTGNNIVVMSAAGEYEPSWAMPPKWDYDEFSYHFTCAINGATPSGKTVNADTDKNGHVSMLEAFNYARAKDTRSETPWYEDSGDGVPHSGTMPKGGDGSLGSQTSLD